MTRGYAYKVLGPDREACHGGSGRWAQRKQWMPLIEQVKLCASGYHLCRDEAQLLTWIGPSIWVAEYEGDVINGGDKIVVGRARLVDRVDAWDERTARLFAADCAEHVVHLNPDPRVQGAIDAARSYARGEISDAELAAAEAAARDAAGAAAWAAARAAAWDAARAAARAAAWAAARAAARAAAWDAARDAEREWQAARLREITGGLPA